MSVKAFIVRNLLRLTPTTIASSVAGELRVDSADSNNLKYYDGSSEDTLVRQAELTSVSDALTTHEADTSTHGVTTIVGISESQILTNKTIDADSNTLSNIENADIKAGAAIDRSKLASGTADHVLINSGAGVMSSEAQLAITRGGTGASAANDAFNAFAPSQGGNSGKYLTTDGSNTSWNTVSSGASTALDNLASVDLNANLSTTKASDLIVSHATAGYEINLTTANNGAGNSGQIYIRPGTATGTRGNIQLAADSIVVGDSGSMILEPANGGQLGTGAAPFSMYNSILYGFVSPSTRFQMTAASTATPSSGSVLGTIQSNDTTGFTIFSVSQAGNTGPLSYETGNSSSFASGNIKVQTGTANTTSGVVTISTGTGATSSGTITLETGTSSATSGAIALLSGDCDAVSGAVTLQSGDSSADSAGGIFLTIGSSVAGNQGGDINLTTGNGLPSGSINFTIGDANDTDGDCGRFVFNSGTPDGTGQKTVMDMQSLDFVIIPVGTADPTQNLQDGAMYYNSTTDKFKGYANGAWVNLH